MKVKIINIRNGFAVYEEISKKNVEFPKYIKDQGAKEIISQLLKKNP